MKVRTIVYIVPVVLLALALVGGSTLFLRLFFLSVLVPLVSYLWTVLSTRGISAQAEKPPEHCQVGKQFQQDITVFNNSKIPKLWLKLENNNGMSEHHNTGVINLSPGSSHCWQSNVHCQRRGRYSLGSVLVTATDPFGLFSRQRLLGEPHSILVYPATFDLPLFELSSSNDPDSGSGYRSINQISPNASGMREFTTGDSLQHIHWRGTAHTGKLMVKLFDADRSHRGSQTVWVVLDMQESAHFGEGEETTEEYSVTIAASLIRKYLERGMRIGMMASGDQTYLFPPDGGEEHLWRLLEALALIRATGKVPVGQMIREQMGHFGDNSVVIITPSPAGQLVDAVRQLKNRVDSASVILLDAASFGGNTNTTNIERGFSLTGVQVFTVRQGDELTRVLSDRFSQLHARMRA